MKEYKTETITIEKTIETKTFCDICGEEVKTLGFENPSYDTEEITLSHEYGVSYPEVTHGLKIDLDICHDCMTNKIVPFLQTFNPNIKYKEYHFS